MAFQVTSKPIPLGLFTITNGTPQRLTANLVAALADPYLPYGNASSANDLWSNKIEIIASVTNSGPILVCIGLTAANTTTYLNIIRAINPGQSWSIGDYDRGNVYQVGVFTVDGTNGDLCHANADTI